MTAREAVAACLLIAAPTLFFECTPAQDATAERVISGVLKAEDYACLAANFLPGKERAVAIAACPIAEGLTRAADDWLKAVEVQRSPDAGK